MSSGRTWQAFHGGIRRSVWLASITAQTRLSTRYTSARLPGVWGRRHATTPSRPSIDSKASPPRSRRYISAAGAILAGAGVAAVSDDAKHAYEATKRAGRVGGALILCINDYRRTLKIKDDSNTNTDEYAIQLKECHKRCALRTLRVCEQNGSIFIKLGQHLSSLHYLLPREWCDTFIPLQDKCPVSSFDSVQAMILHDTGRHITELFATFDPQPIAAASLAQVHLATLADTGERVAVKVQHPALAEWVKMDLSLTRFSFQTLKRFFPEYDLTWLSEEMQVSLPKELDFELEGHNAIEVKSYFAKIPNGPPLVVPGVKWSQRRILVMEYMPGHRLDDFEYLDSHNLDRDEIAASLSRIMNTMIFGTDAPLHCDTHMGNIAIRARAQHSSTSPNFEIILYDHGLYRNPPPQIRQAYARLWLAILASDEPAMRTAAYDLAGITPEQFPLFAAAITGRDYSTITAKQGHNGSNSGGGVHSPRSEAEAAAISSALTDQDGAMIEQLIAILAQVPRIILLILKTNDLTRSLDESLHTRRGPLRQFLILARYAAAAVYEEQIRGWKALSWSQWMVPSRLWSAVRARIAFEKVRLRLGVYELVVWARSLLGNPVGLGEVAPR